MLTLALDEIAEVTAGERLAGVGERVVRGLAIDTRALVPGALFVALPGARVDGHDFVAAAREAGAAAALVARAVDDPLPQVRVDDPVRAMGALAAAWRARSAAPAIGITGSNGKTTVKGMVRAILERDGPCLATKGNYNNELGLPLTVARLGPEHASLALEMGCGKPGDIRYLAAIGRPRVGVITNAAAAHLDRLGTVAGVARVKGELVEALPPDGVAVLNREDRYFPYWRELAGARRVLTFGRGPEASVRVRSEPLGPGQRITLATADWDRTVALALPGSHNALNAAAAAAATLALGATPDKIAAGLAAFAPSSGRLLRRDHPDGWTVLEDTYNANPASLEAGVRVLVEAPRPRWLVLGDMAELGPEAAKLHFEAGAGARRLGVDRLYACGPLCRHAVRGFGEAGRWFADRQALTAALAADLAGGVTCLVKGSRSARMETVVAHLFGEPVPCS